MHTWQSTQTEGWWRLAFDLQQRPVRLHQRAGRGEERRPQREVRRDRLPAGWRQRAGRSSTGCRCGGTRCRGRRRPRRRTSAPGRRPTTSAPGSAGTGCRISRTSCRRAGVLITAVNTADFAIQFGITNGVSNEPAARAGVVGSLCCARGSWTTRARSSTASGDSLAVFSDDGETLRREQHGGRPGGFGGRGRRWRRDARDGARHGRRPGRACRAVRRSTPQFEAPIRPRVQPWQARADHRRAAA